MRRIKKKRRPRFVKVEDCFFCKEKVEPDFKEVKILGRFVSDRGKIVARDRSGICAKHQRCLSRQIKRARYLALLPFLTKIKR